MKTLNERFHVGEKAAYLKTITEKDVQQFAQVTGDTNPVHLDKEYAEHSVFKGQIAHGGLISGLFSTVLGTQLPGEGTIYLGQDSRFIKPVYFGDTIGAEVEISEIIEEKHRIILTTTAYNQNNEKVIVGKATVMVQ